MLKLTIPNLMLSNLRLFLLPKRRLLDFTLLKLFLQTCRTKWYKYEKEKLLVAAKENGYLQNSITYTQGGSILLGDVWFANSVFSTPGLLLSHKIRGGREDAPAATGRGHMYVYVHEVGGGRGTSRKC